MVLTVSLKEGETHNILDEWFPNSFYTGPPDNWWQSWLKTSWFSCIFKNLNALL